MTLWKACLAFTNKTRVLIGSTCYPSKIWYAADVHVLLEVEADETSCVLASILFTANNKQTFKTTGVICMI